MINQQASVLDIHQAYETLRMSHLPINRDRSIPLSQDATDQLQKLDRAFRIALDSKTPIATPSQKTNSSKIKKAAQQTQSNEKDPFHSVVQEWAKTSEQFQSPKPSSKTGAKKQKTTPSLPSTQSTTPTGTSTSSEAEASNKGGNGYWLLFIILVCGMIGYLLSNDSIPVSTTAVQTSGSSTQPRVIQSNVLNQAVAPQHNIALPVVDPLVLALQQELNRSGFNAGMVDGIIGPQTRDAISSAQRALNMYIDGVPSDALLKALRR